MTVVELHNRLHADAIDSVRAGVTNVDRVPSNGDPRWGLSLVVLPDADVSRRLGGFAAQLASLSPNPHMAYAEPDLHITVRSLEGYIDDVPELVIDRYIERVEAALSGIGAIRIGLHGAYLTSTGVVACGLADPTLAVARRRLAQDAEENGWMQVRGGDAERIRNTAHASLMVFRDGTHRDDRLADRVDGSRDLFFGDLTVEQLALVTYSVTDSSVALRARGTVALT